MENYLDDYVVELLHIADAKHNKLIDLGAADAAKTYYLSREGNDNFSEYMLLTIAERIGHIAQTVLGNSAVARVESLVGRNLSHLDWVNGKGEREPKELDKFIRETYKNISFKGINPLFLSVGALRWKVQVSQTEIREVLSPLLIFPIKLIRSASSTPVAIEFVEDDVYFNPCLYQKMLQTLPGDTAEHFPHPNGPNAKFEDPIDLACLGDGNAYFALVEEYVRACRGDESHEAFELVKDTVAIAQYDHSDLCMYYDYLRNRERIREHALIRAVFDPTYQAPEQSKDEESHSYPYFVLPHDSVQEEMIMRVLGGESLIIKGPPGTGKTVTIANMISALIADRKSVLLVSSKISALAEAYHKIPEELRKFALLLDYESEAQAAKIDPALIKRDLRELIEAAECKDHSDSVYEKRNRAQSDRSNAILDLEKHYKATFKTYAVAGKSYYYALDQLCRHPDLQVIDFAKPQQVLLLAEAQYQELLSDVRDASPEFKILSEDGRAAVWRNPWYGITDGVDVERAASYYTKIGSRAEQVCWLLQTEVSELASEPARSSIDLVDMVYAAEGRASAHDPSALQEISLHVADFDSLSTVLHKFHDASADCSPEWVSRVGSLSTDTLATTFQSIPELTLDGALRVNEMKMIYLHKAVFTDARGTALKKEDVTALMKICEQVTYLRTERKNHLSKAWEVFRETEDDAAWKILRDAVPVLQKYAESDATAPSALDFKAKSTVKRLLSLCYLNDTPFVDLVSAVMSIALAEEKQAQIQTELRGMARLYKKELSEREIESIFAGIRYGELIGSRPGTSLTQICACYETVEGFAREMGCDGNDTVTDLKRKYQALCDYRALCAEVEQSELAASLTPDPKTADATAKALCAYHKIQAACRDTACDPAAIFSALRALSDDTVVQVKKLLAAFWVFGKEFFGNRYTTAPDSLTISELAYFAERCDNISFAQAALRYSRVLSRHSEQMKLASFFLPFEYERVKKDPNIGFDEYFEHAVYSIGVQGYRSLLHAKQYPTGRAVVPCYEKISRSDAAIEELNRGIVEKKLLSYIHPDDPSFRFLSHERGANTSVRRLFTENAEAILKLKRCIILSPSTASVLFRHPDYAAFDTVIIDEASQMKSVTLLPVLSRAKQCVIVGDEWQMPPISHFESKPDSFIYRDDEDRPEPSALSLALKSEAFFVSTLVCHYRSRTESIIKFSQERFYPAMRTFPSTLPKKDGLGFIDVYLPDGVCESGVNEVEAQETVARIRRHFERYYDPEKAELTRSFGVVTFGVPQLNRIKEIIRRDKSFSTLWHHNAERQDVDDPFFYCTVETVQGQQTTDLYLSLTYTGRSSLNQNELGSQVFNVAVSRATDSVTVIHSLRAEDTKPDYVRNYLEIVEYFAGDGHTPFVCGEPESNFIGLLREHIVRRYGIPRDRVICDYGVTEGSVRIPLVILSPDLRQAELGLYCESVGSSRYDYVDYHVRYYEILCQMREWKLHRVFIHDWIANTEHEENLLDAAIKKTVTF